MAFLDIGQATVGHTLVAPQRHAPDIWILSEDEAAAVMRSVHRVATLIRDKLRPAGMNVTTREDLGSRSLRDLGKVLKTLDVGAAQRHDGALDSINLAMVSARSVVRDQSHSLVRIIGEQSPNVVHEPLVHESRDRRLRAAGREFPFVVLIAAQPA